MLLTNGVEVPEVTHLPMQLKSDDGHNDAISFHMAKANPHLSQLLMGKSQLSFSGFTDTFLPAGMKQKMGLNHRH
ncbi:MAG: hypothetical protein Ct9H300mP28_26600 [Pseudomonadota bacterium]|nr:MAG: hypothetical protein Ct9H300mP28_26600 [Pseudomonadota bacterium]